MAAPRRSAHEAAQQAFKDGRFEDAVKAFARAVDEHRRGITERGLRFDRDDTRIDLETCEARTLFKLARYEEEARMLIDAYLARSLALYGEGHLLTVEARVVLGSVFVHRSRMKLAMGEVLAVRAAIERGTPVLALAGARSVARDPDAAVDATLWRIPDDAVLAVMRGFYAGLSQDSTPEVALRGVQRGAPGAVGRAAEAFVVWG